ncbi:MAG: LapA family protein [candidate division WOR-3 bacterium]
MRFIALIFVILVVGLLVGFSVINSQTKVDIYLFGQEYHQLPVIFVIFYSFLGGMIFVLVFAVANEIALRRKLAREKKINEDMRKELDALRNLPISEEEEK